MDECKLISVGIGDIKVGKSPYMINTYLGSCIALCLYCEKHKVGGMLHFMLASSKYTKSGQSLKKAKYADIGIPELFDILKKKYNLGPEVFVAKIFGGAKVLSAVKQEIGKDNEKATREILSIAKIRIEAYKTGGEKGYQISFNLNTGKVACRVFGKDLEEY